ncbi:MAG: translation initiation factor IF-3 [Marmoricola sp.]
MRINDRIRVPEVRLVGPNGETVGIVPTGDALRLAQEADLDLVEIAPMGKPPVWQAHGLRQVQVRKRPEGA